MIVQRDQEIDRRELELERLAWDVSVPQDAIKVKVEKGFVTLSGEVDWYYQKEAAQQDIRRLYGVTGVANHTSIKPKVDTADISHGITQALHRSWSDPSMITVSANGGKVRLTGSVHSPQERYIVAETAWGAPGTIAVENNLAVI